MITRIEIENFKSIRDRVSIDLRPITLLFGQNSAGKSTVVQALHYAREILSRRNFDPSKTEHGGNAIDLGGFRTLVHRQDSEKSISIMLEKDITNQDLPFYSETLRREVVQQDSWWAPVYSLNEHVKKVGVEMTIGWEQENNHASIVSLKVIINGKDLAIILPNPNAQGTQLLFLFRNHELLDLDEFPGQTISLNDVINDLTDKEKIEQHGVMYELNEQQSVIPNWPDGLTISSIRSYDTEGDLDEETILHQTLNSLIVGPCQLISEELENFRYIGPLRELPGRNFQPRKFPDEKRWSNGLAAWDKLFQLTPTKVRECSEWLSMESKLNTGYALKVREFVELFIDSAIMAKIRNGSFIDENDLMEELQKLTEKKRIYLIDNVNKLELLAEDIGVGISQLLPIVVSALTKNNGILTVEQPELHVHPAIQVNLGDLFISQIKEKPDICFLLETHSEHLMLRLLRRIEETTDKELPPGKWPLKPEQVGVYYLEPDPEGLKVTELPIDETGEFTRHWPKGFFEERAEELF